MEPLRSQNSTPRNRPTSRDGPDTVKPKGRGQDLPSAVDIKRDATSDQSKVGLKRVVQQTKDGGLSIKLVSSQPQPRSRTRRLSEEPKRFDDNNIASPSESFPRAIRTPQMNSRRGSRRQQNDHVVPTKGSHIIHDAPAPPAEEAVVEEALVKKDFLFEVPTVACWADDVDDM
ncbi:hypothetical protein HDU67_002462 [Dinochytrium kinnereticum]|nr:hypothetical protein HDU67_002462 [Dinochytrium kinnereticum]